MGRVSLLKPITRASAVSTRTRTRIGNLGNYLVDFSTVGLRQDLHRLNITGRGLVNTGIADVRDAYDFGTDRAVGLVLRKVGLGLVSATVRPGDKDTYEGRLGVLGTTLFLDRRL